MAIASVGGPQIQLYSDEAIKKVAEEIKRRMAEIDVLTISAALKLFILLAGQLING